MFSQGLLFELPRMLHSTCFLCQCCHEFFLLSNYTCQLMGSLLAANWTNFDLLPTAFNHLALPSSHKKNTCMSPLPSFHPPKKKPHLVPLRWQWDADSSLQVPWSHRTPTSREPSPERAVPFKRFQGDSREEEFLHRKNMAWHVHSAFDIGNGPSLGEFQTQHSA